jgi:hypothetical protein
MNDTRWSGATVRRTSPLIATDGTWDSDEVARRLAELTRRRDELAPRFARLAERLSDAREHLAAGLPPDQGLDTELIATRDVFGRLYAEARALAEGLGVAIEQPRNTPTLPDISAVLAALEGGLSAERERQQHMASIRRAAALATLDRVARIAYRGPVDADGFAPLRACQRRAQALRDEIAHGEPLPPHADVAALNDGTHRFDHLFSLLDGLPTLDEPDYRRLVNTVSADFDEQLARAAGRGLLVADADAS